MPSLALPDDQGGPAERFEVILIPPIPRSVCCELWPPIIEAGPRSPSLGALVSMPEAAMHEDGLLAAREHDVGRTRKAFTVKPVPVSGAM